ncbi:MAG: acyltransferase [Planctomycetota bacterium]
MAERANDGPTQETPAPRRYMPQLDGLRAIAVAMVAYFHWVPKEFHYGINFGYAGVQLFFVLSGFLITQILLDCRERNDKGYALRAFYARRFLRIFPLFYLVLAVAYVVDLPPVRESIHWHVTYLSNVCYFRTNSFHGAISHFWTLAVEEQFYVVWPAVVLWLPGRWLKPTVISLVLAGLVCRFATPSLFPESKMTSVLPICNFDSLGLGALLAFTMANRLPSHWLRPLFAALPIYAIVEISSRFGMDQAPARWLKHCALMLGFTWLIHRAAVGFTGLAGSVLEIGWLMYLGRISYGLYLIHNFAPLVIRPVTKSVGVAPDGLVYYAVLTAVTISVAAASWRFFESPLNGMKKWFPYSRRSPS